MRAGSTRWSAGRARSGCRLPARSPQLDLRADDRGPLGAPQKLVAHVIDAGIRERDASMHLARERDVAEILGLDYEKVAQAVLTPVAYTKGTDFQPAGRPAPDEVIRWI